MVMLSLHEYRIRVDIIYELGIVVFALFAEHSDQVHTLSSFN